MKHLDPFELQIALEQERATSCKLQVALDSKNYEIRALAMKLKTSQIELKEEITRLEQTLQKRDKELIALKVIDTCSP